jgi:tetratricopeptide (TPR) repeat protein
MGALYRAYDEVLDQDAAVTVMHPRLLRLEGFEARLLRELELLTGFFEGGNAGVLRHELSEPWLVAVSPYVGGRSVRHLLQSRRSLPVQEALWIALQALRCLDIAHQRGFVHRDLKPENLMLNAEPRVSVVGWGLLRIINATTSERISTYGSLFGTPEYMAPDQITVGGQGASSDLYSVGILLFELLTGQQPLVGQTVMEVLKKQIVESLPSCAERGVAVPEDLEALIQQLTAKDPLRRPSSAGEAAGRVEELLLLLPPVDTKVFAEPMNSIRRRGTDRVSAVTASALKALAKRMQDSAQLGMLAFESDPEGALEEAAPEVQATTQELVATALAGDVQEALVCAVEQGKSAKVVPDVLDALVNERKFDEVLRLEGYLSSVAPQLSAVPYYVGFAYEQLGRYDEAEKSFAGALEIAPHDLSAALHRSRCLTELMRIDEAEELLRTTTEVCSSSDVAVAKYAEFLYVVKDDAAAAVPIYERAIRLAPNRLSLRQQLGWIFCELEAFDKAETVLEELIEWSGHAELAQPIMEEVARRRVEQQLEKQASIQSGAHRLVQPADLLGVSWVDGLSHEVTGLRDWEGLRAQYLKVPLPTEVNSRPTTRFQRRLNKIDRMFQSGRYDKVAEIARRGLGDEPQSIPLLLALGRANLELGRYSEALKVYRFILKLDPDVEEARKGYNIARKRRDKNRESAD